ncbi:MAG: hypothetical protein V7637_2458 [Mycobacteriales bacterium]
MASESEFKGDAVNDLPGYVWAAVLIGVVGLPAAAIVALASGARAVRPHGRSIATIAIVAGTVWAGWLAGGFALADAGVYQQRGNAANPWIAVAFLAALVAVLLATRIPTVARILADPGTPARLALPQTFRIVGGVFLVVLGLGALPAVFAVPAGLGDVAVGVAAPFVARRLSHGTGRRDAVWFNMLGIVDLVVAVSVGFLAGLGPTSLLHVTPTTAALTTLPLALIPTTAVPLAVALHVTSLRRLRATSHATMPAAGRTVRVTG